MHVSSRSWLAHYFHNMFRPQDLTFWNAELWATEAEVIMFWGGGELALWQEVWLSLFAVSIIHSSLPCTGNPQAGLWIHSEAAVWHGWSQPPGCSDLDLGAPSSPRVSSAALYIYGCQCWKHRQGHWAGQETREQCQVWSGVNWPFIDLQFYLGVQEVLSTDLDRVKYSAVCWKVERQYHPLNKESWIWAGLYYAQKLCATNSLMICNNQ